MAICATRAATATERRPTRPGTSGQVRDDLSGLDDRELLAIASSLPRSSDRREAARDLLVSRHRALVVSCARQYSPRPEATQDLIQVAYVGLLKAINNFDPAFGYGLSSYARSYIIGELKRDFRDRHWPVHIERPLQELLLQVKEASGRLTQQLGRLPADAELASQLSVRDADIRLARQAELALRPKSLDEPARGQAGAATLTDVLGQEDPRIDHVISMQALAVHWPELPAREQNVLILRFYGGMTQTQVGQQLGISQMQVSRLLTHALTHLRQRLAGRPLLETRPRARSRPVPGPAKLS